MVILLQALAVFSVLFVDFVSVAALSETRTTNAERFKRGLPPLPPRGVVSNHRRYVRPVHPRSGQLCPSSAPVTCTGNCGYISLTGTAAPFTNYGYISSVSGSPIAFGTTACTSSAAVFIFPSEAPDTLFTITQNTPAYNDNFPLFGAGGPYYDGTFDPDDKTEYLYFTSTDQDDPDILSPNYSDSSFGPATAESTVWSFVDAGDTTLQLSYAPGGVWEAANTVAMTVLLAENMNVLLAVSDPTYYLSSNGALAELTLTVSYINSP